MTFDSLTFFAFLAIVWAIYAMPLSWRTHKAHLLLASYFFYAAWNPPFVALLWLSTVADWLLARAMMRSGSPSVRRLWLVGSLTVNLGVLGFFKYGSFLLENFTAGLATLGIAYRPPPWDIILPVGISFYTFQTLSFTIDVYRGHIAKVPGFLDFALFVAYFPQLVAGPIVRAADFLPQLERRPTLKPHWLGWGLALLTVGLFQKVVLADAVFAPVAEAVFDARRDVAAFDAWLGTLAFAGQIFCDFAGYSSCAIGVAMLFGFRLPDNFRAPYAALGFSDFWRRWHISLSSWLRDYLYVPLGGNRHGRVRTHLNLMTTMLLGGLWHGASWNFVAWGGLHGSFLVVERQLRGRWGGWPGWRHPLAQGALIATTFVAVCLAWVPFRAADFAGTLQILAGMAGMADTAGPRVAMAPALAALGALAALIVIQVRQRHRSLEHAWSALPTPSRALLLAGFWLAIVVAPFEDRAFIYFQF